MKAAACPIELKIWAPWAIGRT